jgi:RimJ/RimL family protein N-acetyltransferase
VSAAPRRDPTAAAPPGGPEPAAQAAPAAPRAEVTVRPAREADLDALVELYAAVAAEGRWIGAEAPVDRERRRQRFAEQLHSDSTVMLVADARGQLVGQLGLHVAGYGVADLGMLVAEGWRRRGVGSALLREGIDRARQAGAHKVSLQVWPHNRAAIALYERFGFRREGRLRRHYRRRSGELWDAILMGLPLD